MYLDHIVHFTEQEPAKSLQFWQSRKFHAITGGRHEKWGTYNALLYLKNCYVEWLAIDNLKIAEEANHPLTRQILSNRSGFGPVCLRTNAIEELNSRLQREGFRTTGVLDAERRTEDGVLIKWRMLFIDEEVSSKLPSPFFIEWQENEEIRYEKLRKSGAIQPTNEELEIERCVFRVHSIEESEKKWRKLLGGELELDNSRIEFVETDMPKEQLEVVYFKQGEQKIEFENGLYYVPCLP